MDIKLVFFGVLIFVLIFLVNVLKSKNTPIGEEILEDSTYQKIFVKSNNDYIDITDKLLIEAKNNIIPIISINKGHLYYSDLIELVNSIKYQYDYSELSSDSMNNTIVIHYYKIV